MFAAHTSFWGRVFIVLARGHHVDRKRAQDELRTSSWRLVLDENSCLSLDFAQRRKVIKEHFLDLFLSKPGRYSRYSRYREGAQGGQTLCFCFLDGGAPGLGTCERGPQSERSKTHGLARFQNNCTHHTC